MPVPLSMTQQNVREIANYLQNRHAPHAGWTHFGKQNLMALAHAIAAKNSPGENANENYKNVLADFIAEKDSDDQPELQVTIRLNSIDTIARTLGEDAAKHLVSNTESLLLKHCHDADVIFHMDPGIFTVVLYQTKQKPKVRALNLMRTINSTMTVWDGHLVALNASFSFDSPDNG